MIKCAVIITHNRPDLLKQTVNAIAPQVEEVIILDNASETPVNLQWFEDCGSRAGISVTFISTQPPNLAELWAEGIRQVKAMGDGYIAFLCDDSPPPPGWYDAVLWGMQETGAAIGCSSPWGGPTSYLAVKTQPDRDIGGRMPGWAFVLDSRSSVRPDTSMHWWWFDTDLDFQARLAGGMVMIGGYPVENIHPNEYTYSRPWASERIHFDTIAFEAKWGPRPW